MSDATKTHELEMVPVLIPDFAVKSAPMRLLGAAAMARTLSAAADGDVSDALCALAHGLDDLATDLDVCQWTGGSQQEVQS